jgi:hypothetical protein
MMMEKCSSELTISFCLVQLANKTRKNNQEQLFAHPKKLVATPSFLQPCFFLKYFFSHAKDMTLSFCNSYISMHLPFARKETTPLWIGSFILLQWRP